MSKRTFEAVIDEHGVARFPDAVRLPRGTKVWVTLAASEDIQTEFELPELKPGTVYKIASPRLADPSQAHRFEMVVTEAIDNADV